MWGSVKGYCRFVLFLDGLSIKDQKYDWMILQFEYYQIKSKSHDERLLKCTRWLSNCCQLNRSRRLEWNLRGSLWLLVSSQVISTKFSSFFNKVWVNSFLDIDLLPSLAPNYQPEVLMIDIASTFVNILRVPAALCITCPQMSILTRLQSFPPRPLL